MASVPSWPILKEGSTGINVYALQCLLNYRNGTSISVDGTFGAGTRSAVVTFQNNHNLLADGQAGEATLSKMITTIYSETKNSAAKAAQYLVSKFESISVDGDYGAGSANAVKTFQQKMGISVDGGVGPQTWQYLFGYNTYPGTGTTTPVGGDLTKYSNAIHNTPLIFPSGGSTFCNVWAQNVMKTFGTPLPDGACGDIFNSLHAGFTKWKPLATYTIGGSYDINNPNYLEALLLAQKYANAGVPAIALTALTQNSNPANDSHIAVVSPHGSTLPQSVRDVLVSCSGVEAACFYDGPLSNAWGSKRWPFMMFFYYAF